MAPIDLNCDLGEARPGTPRWELSMRDNAPAHPEDEHLLDVVTSANIACGFHAGNPYTMRATVRAACVRGVAIGAHPSYLDLEHFGRHPIDIGAAELVAQIDQQLTDLDAAASASATIVHYVKPHGALYNRIVHDEQHARAVIEAIVAHARRHRRDPLPVLGLPGSAVLELAQRAGVPTVTEAFADRGYRPDGTLVPRQDTGAVIEDPEQVAARVLAIVGGEPIVASDGTPVNVSAQSICLHSDTAGAIALARQIRAALAAAAIPVTPFVAVDGGNSPWARR